jgi:DNA-binding Lrp family transcriptional regulator
MSLKLSKKETKILAELDRNSRQTDSQIAKRVGLSKQVVNYRISNLLKKGIIVNFYTSINIAKMGFNSYYVFLKLANLNKQEEENLIKQLKSMADIGWIITGIGKWDACLLLFSDSIKRFDLQLSNITNLCGKNLYDYSFSILINSEHLSYKFINPKNSSVVEQKEKDEVEFLDNKDLAVLRQISDNARISLTDIQKKTKISMHTAAYRIKALEKRNVILGYKPLLNISKLGYQWHLLLLRFQNISEKRKGEFVYFCENNKKIYYITRTTGIYNLLMDVHVESSEEFRDFVQELRDKFADVIKIYESIFVFKEHKINYLPETLS